LNAEANPEMKVELLRFIHDHDHDHDHGNQTAQAVQSQVLPKSRVITTAKPPVYITDVVDNDSKTLEVMESNNNQQSHNSQEEWQKEIEEPNALAYVIFNSRDYSKYFAKNQDWIHIRFVMKHELEAGNYSLKFKAIRGNLENQKVLLDNIKMKTSFTQKTDKEIPDTTTTTTTTTITTTTKTTTTTQAAVTTTTMITNSSTQAPIQGPPPGDFGGNLNASSEAFVNVLLVGTICAIGVLTYKHNQIRSKLREYEVTQIQNYDNPMFTGQHTPAERYGSIQNP
jgi:hypothetical protein